MTEPLPDYTTPTDPDHTIGSQAQQVYNYICRHKATHDGNAPTLRQIAAGSGLAITSTATVTHHLRKLSNAGLIRLSKRGGSCGIEVVGGKWTPPAGEQSHEAHITLRMNGNDLPGTSLSLRGW